MKNDEIAQALQAVEWSHATTDPQAVAVLEARLADAGRRNRPISYSDLVRDVVFTLSDGQHHQIDIHDWTARDGSILGGYLGYISMRSYTAHGFMASAIAVEAAEQRPSKGFFLLMRQIGALTRDTEQARLALWVQHLNLAHEHYRSLPALEPLPTAAEFDRYARKVLEGVETPLTTKARSRCDAVRSIARERYRSPDGFLRCEVCRWMKPCSELAGDLVELHHRNPLADAPSEGRQLTLEEAISSLAPLCPNCHRVAHAKPGGGTFSTDEIRRIIL